MKRLAVLCVVVSLLLSAHVALGAEATAPTTERMTLNPIPPPVVPEEEKDPLEAIGDYIWNRFRDFADIFTLKLGWGTDKALGFQFRAIGPLQVGAGIFEGYVFAIDRGCIGVYKEAEVEFGISVLYPSWIARKVVWQTPEAKRRNIFFGNAEGEVELDFKKMQFFDDENQGWFVTTIQFQLPYLPKFELSLNWGELPDFLLSFAGIDGFRVPPAYHLRFPNDGDAGERVPAPSILWHGQEKYESYK